MTDEKRLVDIEIKMTHQEVILNDLSDVVFKQQQFIDGLERRLSALIKRIESADKDDAEIGPADDKPPHY